MKLHGYFRSSAAFRVRIVLNLKGLAYGNVFHHLRRDEQREPAYLAVNPQGLVPALETEDGAVITQSLAIIDYLDELIPTPPMLPSAPLDRARVRSIALQCAADIHPIDNLRVLRYLRTEMEQDEAAVQAWYRHWVEIGFEALEPALRDDARTGRFCHGDTPGLADACLIPQVFNAVVNRVDMAPFPTLQRIYDEAVAHPAFERALPANQPDAE